MSDVSSTGMKVLIQQTGFLGDAVLATALAKEVRARGIARDVGFVVRAEYGDLFELQSPIDSLYRLEKRDRTKRRGVIDRIRADRYDLLLSPHRSFSSAMLGFTSGISRRIGFRVSDGAFLYTERVEYRPGISEIERNADLLAPFGRPRVPFEMPEIAPIVQSNAGGAEIRTGVGIFFGSVWQTKQWGKERFADLASRLFGTADEQVYLLGSRAERDLGESIRSAAGLPQESLLAGELTLPELATFLSRLRVTVTNDSGGLHLSEAVGTPVVAIFGPTIREFGFSPWRAESVLVETDRLDCRPCGIHGAERCPLRHHRCMVDISVDQVLAEVLQRESIGS